MFPFLEFLLLSCFFLTVESQQDQVLPPQNVNLVWINGFKPQLSWQPQQNCTYIGTSKTSEVSSYETHEPSSPWSPYFLMGGGFLELTVQTVCNGKSSNKVVRRVEHPELVKNLQCYIHAAKQAYCSWSPASPALDPRFFYRFPPRAFSTSNNDKSPPVIIKECSSYNFTNGVRTGCNLEASVHDVIHALFNGTVNNKPAWNTFKKDLYGSVRAPPLNWTVTKTDDEFNISWTPSDIPGPWTYVIDYTECEENKTKNALNGKTSAVLDLVPHCPYRICIRACRGPGGWTEWSENKYFAANIDSAAWVYAAIIIPLVFAGLAVLIILCFRKNKDIIFPKVPEPLDLISDISDNNNKIAVRNLYIPVEEEESCKITLVTEP